MREQRIRFLICVAAGAILALAGCGVTKSDGEIDSIIQRKLTWPDFIGGGDLRRNCALRGNDRYRLVLNANRAQQVRVYDLDFARDTLRTRIVRPSAISRIEVSRAGLKSVTGPLEVSTVLPARRAADLKAAVRSDMDTIPQTDMYRLLSEWWFWAVSGCRDGEPVLRVWVNPDPTFRALNFPKLLLAEDRSGVQLPRPPDGPRPSKLGFVPGRETSNDYYELFVDKSGFAIGQQYGRSNRTQDN